MTEVWTIKIYSLFLYAPYKLAATHLASIINDEDHAYMFQKWTRRIIQLLLEIVLKKNPILELHFENIHIMFCFTLTWPRTHWQD